MHQFTIKDIENLSGIKAHTLRIWEQRYSLLVPKRKESNHRFYDNDDLKNILRVSFLYHNGYKISKIAKLNQDEMKEIALHDYPQKGYEYYINEMVEASLDFDEDRFEDIYKQVLEKLPMEECMSKVIYPYLDKIGVLWLTDHVIPAQEHFTSNVIRQKLIAGIDLLGNSFNNKNTFLLFSPQQEFHEIPLLFIHYVLKKHGNKVFYFGSNTSIESIKTFAQHKPFTHLYFHLITNFTNKEVDEYVLSLSRLFTNKKILGSGSQVSKLKVRPENVHYINSYEELMVYAKEVGSEKKKGLLSMN